MPKLMLSLAVAASADGNGGLYFFVVLFLVVLVIWLIKGFQIVPVGARGILVQLGRRTGEMRPEGLTWLPAGFSRLDIVYVRERQIDVPATNYHTQDRARISFKTTLRISISDPALLLDQGPGTYAPFERDGKINRDSGSEEDSVALNKLMQNAIREAVRTLSIEEVMFGPHGEGLLQSRILERLSRTCRRWGLSVHEVWLTGVEASDEDLGRAVQSEVRGSMEGRGRLAEHRAELEKANLFVEVAQQMVETFARSGRSIPLEAALMYLQERYRDEREIEIALRSAGNVQQFLHGFMMRSDSTPGLRSAPPFLLDPLVASRTGLPRAQWVIGREGNIIVEGEGVSRRHAVLEVDQDRMIITDLGSTNGTFLGEQRLQPNIPTAVLEGTPIRFGKKVIFSHDELLKAAGRAS